MTAKQQDEWFHDQTPEAPPSANGELVFEAPWEARAFGMAQALAGAGCFDWDEFREHLIAVISDWDARHPDGSDYHYYHHWLTALEAVLERKGLTDSQALASLTQTLAARPHGHDHDH